MGTETSGGAGGETTTVTTTTETTETKGTEGAGGEATQPDKGEGDKKEQQTQDPKGAKPDSEKGGEPKGQESTPADFDVTLPKGVEADPKMLEEYKAVAKQVGLNGEAAQKVIDVYAKFYQTSLQQQTDAFVRQQETWVKEIKEDKELGGDKLQTTKNTTDRAMKRFASEDFTEFLNSTGFTNHPSMVRFLHRVGQAMKEDSIAGTSAQQGSGQLSERDLALRRYSNTKF